MSHFPRRGLVFRATVAFLLCVTMSRVSSARQSTITAIGDSSQDAPKPVQVVAPPAGSAAPVDSGTYKVGPGDILSIDVWKQTEFTGNYTVHSDGKITMKLVNDLDVGGKTPKDIQEIVKTALAKYIRDPLVTVTVQAVISKRYYLDGLANRPGEYPLTQPTTVFQALSRAGGLQEFANQKKIYILRGDKRIPFNYKEVIHGKNLEQNIQLQSDDHIVVP